MAAHHPTPVPPSTATATGAGALVAALVRHGVDTIFGIPGTHNLAIYEELDRAGVRCVTPRHEQGAGYAADGYARATGRPGVVVTTTGPGVVNAATALAQAYSDSSPILLVSPGVPTRHPRQGRGYLHESRDQSRALDALCEWSHRVSSVREVPAAVARAFARFAEGRPRPVHIEIPEDLLDESESGVKIVSPSRIMPRIPDPAALDQAARLLRGAVRPGFVLGGGAQAPGDGEPAVGGTAMLLAERVGARVVTTVNGKGAVPESHPLVLGATLHLAAVRRWLADCDVVLAVGTELGPAELWQDPYSLGGTLIRVDVDPGQMYGDHVADVAIVADAGLALSGLAERVAAPRSVPGSAPASVPAQRSRVHPATAWHEPSPGPDYEAELRELTRRWTGYLEAIRRALPEDTIVVGDNSMVVYHGALVAMPMDPPGRFLFPSGYGTLGFALPAGIGAKIGCPGRPVAVLAGDGAFQFSLQELAAAVELGLSLPIVVCVNGGYGQIRDEMRDRGMRPVAVDLHGPDLPALAVSYGALGREVKTPGELEETLAEALLVPLPTVIVMTENE
ncbi:acetolactate synthase [Microbispora sp. RL4-1S]|uniref:Acetolactate synthase n=1 Tax=Microbispora oryzae TaxID=2806554 RepID=A0A940WJY7_9ACTN|nr:thiamine pyrophosphate-binding protein [Microbispora oryzae]MBP2707030.1 acetolactate synthase [Microbispora oryzae]